MLSITIVIIIIIFSHILYSLKKKDVIILRMAKKDEADNVIKRIEDGFYL